MASGPAEATGLSQLTRLGVSSGSRQQQGEHPRSMAEQRGGQGEVVNAKPVPLIPRQEGERGTAGQTRKQQDTGLENKQTNKSHQISHFAQLKCGFCAV